MTSSSSSTALGYFGQLEVNGQQLVNVVAKDRAL